MRILNIVLSFLFFAFLSGCSEPVENTDFVVIKNKSFEVDSKAQSLYIEFDVSNDWHIETESSSTDWFRITPQEGKAMNYNALIVEIVENKGYDDRVLKIIINSGDSEDYAEIIQSCKETLSAEKECYDVSAEAQELTIELRTNVDFNIYTDVDWIKFRRPSETRALETSLITLIIDENTSLERNASILFYSDDASVEYTIQINQADPFPERAALVTFFNKTRGSGWLRSDNWCSESSLSEWYGIDTDENGKIVGIRLTGNNLCGNLPTELLDFTDITHIDLSNNNLEGEFIAFHLLEELTYLDLSSNNLYDQFPIRATSLIDNGVDLRLYNNCFYGEIPHSLQNRSDWNTIALKNIRQYSYIENGNVRGGRVQFDRSVYIPHLTIKDLMSGTEVPLYDIFNANKYTMLFHWNPSDEEACDYLKRNVDRMNRLFAGQGFKAIAIIPEGEEYVTNASKYIIEQNITCSVAYKIYDSSGTRPILLDNPSPSYLLIDSDGKLIQDMHDGLWGNVNMSDGYLVDMKSFAHRDYLNILFREKFGICEYESTDFNSDYQFEKLQSASYGSGIDIILLGESFTDIDIQCGFYREMMTKQYDAIFSIEPMKTYKDYFNVYLVYAVSPLAYLTDYATDSALGTVKDANTGVDNYFRHMREYVYDNLGIHEDKEIFCSIILNSPAGNASDGVSILSWDRGTGSPNRGYAFYVPGNRKTLFNVAVHESIGHCLGLLGDEYDSINANPPTQHEIQNLLENHKNGIFKNISATDNPDDVPWSHLIGNEKYPNIGIFEGANYHMIGFWRSEQNSIMTDADEHCYFNTYSRELIVRRIMNLAGEEFSIDNFFAKDIDESINRKTKGNMNEIIKAYSKHQKPILTY